MSPLDPSTLDSATPSTIDGRAYPDHLRLFEAYDADLLPLVIDISPFELADLQAEARMEHGHDAALVARWFASAEWRGLIRRLDTVMGAPRRYRATSRAEQRLEHLGGDC